MQILTPAELKSFQAHVKCGLADSGLPEYYIQNAIPVLVMALERMQEAAAAVGERWAGGWDDDVQRAITALRQALRETGFGR